MHTGDKQHQKLQAEANKHGKYGDPVFCGICFKHTASKDYGFDQNPHNLLVHLVSAHGYKPKRWWQIWR